MIPCPETLEKVSIQPITTFGILYLIIMSVQGGVFPWWQQGSRLTYSIEFLSTDLSLTELIAFTSAWFVPNALWCPLPNARLQGN